MKFVAPGVSMLVEEHNWTGPQASRKGVQNIECDWKALSENARAQVRGWNQFRGVEETQRFGAAVADAQKQVRECLYFCLKFYFSDFSE